MLRSLDRLKDHLHVFFWDVTIQNPLPILISSFPWQLTPTLFGADSLAALVFWFARQERLGVSMGGLCHCYSCTAQLNVVSCEKLGNRNWYRIVLHLSSSKCAFSIKVCLLLTILNTLDIAFFLHYVPVFCSPRSSRRVLDHRMWTIDIVYLLYHSD